MKKIFSLTGLVILIGFSTFTIACSYDNPRDNKYDPVNQESDDDTDDGTYTPGSGSVPGTVQNLTASDGTGSVIELVWSEVSAYVDYEIWRSDSESGTYTLIDTETFNTDYNDTPADKCIEYYYKVRAIDVFDGTPGAFSNIDSGYVAGLYTVPVPSNLDVNIEASSWISLQWDYISAADYYEVWRATTESGTYSKRPDDPTTASYTDDGLPSGTTYWYKVRSCTDCGIMSDFTNPISGTTD